jgi:uncharacterized Zn-binding protein involved in type VI secretion
MQGMARVTDVFEGTCSNHKNTINITGQITTGSGDILINGLQGARQGDLGVASCGHTGVIVSYSSTVISNEKGAARIGDSVVGEGIDAVITTGSADVICG